MPPASDEPLPADYSLPSDAKPKLDGIPGEDAQIRRRRPKIIVNTKEVLSKQTNRILKKANEHEHFINKLTYCIGVVGFGAFCFLLGSRPQDIPYMYCAFFLFAIPLRWIYYRTKKWHYFLLDFCYYANVIFTIHLLFFHAHEKLFLLCFAFSEGPLAWALIVWRCSLVFSSLDKIVSVLIHLLPGTVIFIIRWWDPVTLIHHPQEETGPWPAWPLVSEPRELWLWLFCVPLLAYSLWQIMYWFIVDYLRKQRFINDPEVMTSYRELSRKAAKANNVWWRISGVLGDSNRVLMYAVFQAIFTVLTMALAVPMFKSYRFHAAFQIFKILASIWNGCNFFFDVMPRQVTAAKEKKLAARKLENGSIPTEVNTAKIYAIPSDTTTVSKADHHPVGQTAPSLDQNPVKPDCPSSSLELESSSSEMVFICPSCRRPSFSNLSDMAAGPKGAGKPDELEGSTDEFYDFEKENWLRKDTHEDVSRESENGENSRNQDRTIPNEKGNPENGSAGIEPDGNQCNPSYHHSNDPSDQHVHSGEGTQEMVPNGGLNSYNGGCDNPIRITSLESMACAR